MQTVHHVVIDKNHNNDHVVAVSYYSETDVSMRTLLKTIEMSTLVADCATNADGKCQRSQRYLVVRNNVRNELQNIMSRNGRFSFAEIANATLFVQYLRNSMIYTCSGRMRQMNNIVSRRYIHIYTYSCLDDTTIAPPYLKLKERETIIVFLNA